MAFSINNTLQLIKAKTFEVYDMMANSKIVHYEAVCLGMQFRLIIRKESEVLNHG